MRLPEANSAVPATKWRVSEPSGGPSRSRVTTAAITFCTSACDTSSSVIPPTSSISPSRPLTAIAMRNSRSVRRTGYREG